MGIGEYFLSVIAASVISALIVMIVGDGKTAIAKSVDTVCSLFLLCVIVSPIATFVARAKDGFDIVSISESYDSAASAEEVIYASLGAVSGDKIEEAILDHLLKRTEIDEADVDVRAEVSVSDGSVMLDRVVVELYGAARWSDPRAIAEAVGELTDSECIIVNGE